MEGQQVSDERNERGQYKAGHAPANGSNKGGRPSKARELARLAILQEVVTLDKWKAIVEKAVRDALGVRIAQTSTGPKVEDDPGSDGRDRDKARRFIAEYTIGKPTQPLALGDDLLGILAGLSPEDYEAVLSRAEEIIGGGSGQTSGDAGTGASDRGAMASDAPSDLGASAGGDASQANQ